jgi:hypothetical protein
MNGRWTGGEDLPLGAFFHRYANQNLEFIKQLLDAALAQNEARSKRQAIRSYFSWQFVGTN